MNRTVTVTRSKDDDGVPIISIPIANSNKPAILYQEDFDLLLSLNIDPRWTFNANLVLERGQLPIARILFDAKAGEKVRYKDGNSLNLKPDEHKRKPRALWKTRPTECRDGCQFPLILLTLIHR